MSMLVAAQVLAIATAALAVLAVPAGLFAGLAFRKQSAEVKLLQEQAKRDSDERRRAQASHVFLTKTTARVPMPTGPAGSGVAPAVSSLVKVRLTNSSDQPVFEVEFTWYWGDRKREPTVRPAPIAVVLPGKGTDQEQPAAFKGVGSITADATFRDAAGVWWRRGLGGRLYDLTPAETAKQRFWRRRRPAPAAPRNN
jgi:hypothetical protein